MGRLLAEESVGGPESFIWAIGTLHVRVRDPVFLRAGVSFPEGEFTGGTFSLHLFGALIAWGAVNRRVSAILGHLWGDRGAKVDSVGAEFVSGARLACSGVLCLINVVSHLANGLCASELIADRVCWTCCTGGG